LAELGVQPHVVEAVLNHVSGHKAEVAGIYNRSSYATEQKAALNLWAAHVESLVKAELPSAVLKFPAKAGNQAACSEDRCRPPAQSD
jgi:hypothetical protein